MPHWYGARFTPELLEELGIDSHFFDCGELVRRTTVRRLTRPRDLDSVTDVAQLVEEGIRA
jgi:hypothetical protein